MFSSTVLRPDFAGPPITNAGTPWARSGPKAVSSSPPTPTSAHSGEALATGSRMAQASAKEIRLGRTSTRKGRRERGSPASRAVAASPIAPSAAA